MNRVIESKRMLPAGPLAYMGEKSNVYWVLVTEVEGKRIYGSPKCR
jgi:hypothetical protein